MSENPDKEFLLETTVSGMHLAVYSESIVISLGYTRPIIGDNPYLFCAITKFKAKLFANAMCTNPVPMGGFLRREFIPGKIKPEYALMNKIIHNIIMHKEKEKLPSEGEIKFLFEVMNGRLIVYGVVIWCIMRDFIKSTSEKSYIPYLALVTKLVDVVGIKARSRKKMVAPRLGPITSITKSKSKATSVKPSLAQPPLATSEASSSSTLQPKSTSSLKRMEFKIKGLFKCILGKQKQIDHKLSVLKREVHILRGKPSTIKGPLPNLEGDSDKLDDYVDEDAFSTEEEDSEEEYLKFLG